ncbi:MAG: ATP-binding protein, partial [Candidatus Nanopelagicales bacterium]
MLGRLGTSKSQQKFETAIPCLPAWPRRSQLDWSMAVGFGVIELVGDTGFDVSAPSPVCARSRRREEQAIATPNHASAMRGQALIGRDTQVAQLANAVDAAMAGQAPAVVEVRGEPGIGKSTLLDVLAS